MALGGGFREQEGPIQTGYRVRPRPEGWWPPPFTDRSRSHQLRITLKSDSSEPEVTGGSVSGANCLLSVVGELMNYAFPGVVLGSAASFKGGLQSTKSQGI